MKNGLSAFALKMIAVLAMLCDHIAWAFVDEFSAAGQAMHVAGRLTIPIMCFFIAEGLRHTASLKKYSIRLAVGWLVSAVPFWLFFGEMYGYRQNIMFDLLLALLTAALLGSRDCKTPRKALGTAGLLAVSVLIGGWPVLPILFVLVFYFIEDRKKRTIVFLCLNTLFVTLVILLIALNERLHFAGYNWVWSEKLYLFGFSFALLPLWFYNGERGCAETEGRRVFGKYFFYVFYPLHLLVLVWIRAAS